MAPMSPTKHASSSPDTGTFTTLDIRPRHPPRQLTTHTIVFPKNAYDAPPNIAGGFQMLDLGASTPPLWQQLPSDNITPSGTQKPLLKPASLGHVRRMSYSSSGSVSSQGIGDGDGTSPARDGGGKGLGRSSSVRIGRASADGDRKLSNRKSVDFSRVNRSAASHPNATNATSSTASLSTTPRKLRRPSAPPPNVRANLVGDLITAGSFRIAFETWGGDGTRLYAAGAGWIERRRGAKECVFGQFDSREVTEDGLDNNRAKRRNLAARNGIAWKDHEQQEDEYLTDVTFPAPFKRPPRLVCWLNRLDLEGQKEAVKGRWRFGLCGSAENVTESGATLKLRGKGVNGSAMCWIAFPEGKRKVDSGVFEVGISKGTDGFTKFRKGCFGTAPTVVAALTMVEVVSGSGDSGLVDKGDDVGGLGLRVKVEVLEVNEVGFKWRLETWGDSILVSAKASWIALGFV